MKVTKIKIKKVAPAEDSKGLVGFASCVVDDVLYLGNIAIFSRLNEPEKLRLVFPIKEVGDNKISVFYPLTSDLYYILEDSITEKFYEND